MERKLITEELVDHEEILLAKESESYQQLLEDQDISALKIYPDGKKSFFYKNILCVFTDTASSTLVAFSRVRQQQEILLKRITFDASVPYCIFSLLNPTKNYDLNRLYNQPGPEGSDAIRFYHPYLIEKGENLPLKFVEFLMCASVKRYSGRLSGVFYNPYKVTTTVASLDADNNPLFATFDSCKSPVELGYGHLPNMGRIFLN
ncbi:hypothetical protein HYU94_00545 [Candidatus Daviesbacteria bacterium]|nr:hypothetical protein [Candidatus Daviesbacteria bacterium]